MKSFWKQFVMRGLMFAWGGPVVVAIVWLCIWRSGEIEILTVDNAVVSILSSVLLAFIAAGISAIHQVEHMPTWSATMIHLLVMYADYLLIYLLNGWIMPATVIPFTIIFLVAYAVIWAVVYTITTTRVRRMNEAIRVMEDQ